MKPTTITLPGERAEQLRALAGVDGCTISEVIERLINNEIAAGTIPDRLPGFEATAVIGSVLLTVGDFTFPALNTRQAKQLATILEEMGNTSDVTRGKQAKFVENEGEITLSIARKGRGIRIAGDDAQNGRVMRASMTAGMARDLARMIRTEAAKAAAHVRRGLVGELRI